MIDNIIELNTEGTLVELVGLGVQTSYPCKTQYREQITQWLEGRSDEWDAQKEAYDNYQAILAYEACITGVIPEEGCGVKPHGWYTQEEVDASQTKWDAWNTCELANPGECGREPIVLKRPADLPVVAEPPVLIPNTITPYAKPITETISEKATEIYAAFQAEANADVVSGGQTWRGGAESAMLLNGQADKANHRGNVTDKVHSKNHVAHTLNPNQIKDIAADVADAYAAANTKFHAKMLELEACGLDETCINNIVW